ncbi:MAG TPA: hypothetical protein VH255_02580 [Verrucomicrobiae bacterium]|nr:hypothetical protein [Verrucomicrobiae bacterium]
MINRHESKNTRVIIKFGQAPLVETAENKLELKGASRDEQTEAKEFVSLFMHEAILSFVE